MNSRERVKRALEFKNPDRVPRNLWKLPGVKEKREYDLVEVLKNYPEDIDVPEFKYGKGYKKKGIRYKKGEVWTDEWGCQWHAAEDGVVGEVKNPPLRDLAEARMLRAPYEILEGADVNKINGYCGHSDKFVLGWTTVRPFERMQFLLGPENLFLGLANVSNDLYYLRDTVHEFFLEELKCWGLTRVDGISFMDDWGAQHSLLISPDSWRKMFKPLYKEYCDVIKSSGKYVFFHSDGYIEPIFADLIEIGVDAVNSQLFCMNIEELGKRYRGYITFWGEIDRQRTLPFGTKDEVIRAVKRVKDALWMPEGGVIAQCEFGIKDLVENIKTVFGTWESIT
jgi:hypothetical protein